MEYLVPERNKFGETIRIDTQRIKKLRELGEDDVADFMNIL